MIEHELPEGWDIKKLGEVAMWSSGGTPLRKHSEYYNGDILWIKTGELGDKYLSNSEEKITRIGLKNSNAKLFPKKSVIVAMYGATIGKTSILKVEASTNQACAVAQCNPAILYYEFLYYFLVYSKHSFTKLGIGGAQPNISQNIIKSYLITYPIDITKQKQIVTKIEQLFGELDDGVNILQTLKSQVKLYRQSILKAAFNGKLTGSYVSDDELPTGWDIKQLVDITSVLGDGLHGTPRYDDNGEYYFINGNNLSNGKIILKENTKKVSELEYEKYKKPLTKRSVLVSINGTLGNIAFYNNEKIILGKSACYFNLIDNIDKKLIKYFLTSPCFKNYAFTEATGTTIKNVSLKSMREFKVPIPSIIEQQQIVAKIEQLFNVCDELDHTIDNAFNQSQLLRQSILKQAFSGKLI